MTDIPAQMARVARGIDRNRLQILSAIALVWIALFALSFSGGVTLSRGRATAMAVVVPFALVGMWIVMLWAWFGRNALVSSGERSRAWTWLQSVFLLFFGVVVIFMCYIAMHLFLSV